MTTTANTSRRLKHPTESSLPVVDLIYYNAEGAIAHKYVYWQKEPTADLLRDWIADYYDKVTDGYIPKGFAVAPLPFCARIYKCGNLLAEWMGRLNGIPSPTARAESPVTARPLVGRGGIPEAAPSTPTSPYGPRKVTRGKRVSRPRADTTGKSAVNDAVVTVANGVDQVSL